MNYQLMLDEEIAKLSSDGGRIKPPSLLLHSCCAPCSSYVLEYLSDIFSITVLYYNPNITDSYEYNRRREEQQRLILAMNAGTGRIAFMEGRYCQKEFMDMSRGLEDVPEGGERCRRCFELRLREAAAVAAREGFEYFTTTLSISPLKNAAILNELGGRLAEEYGVRYLFSDFKKRDGYKRSIQLSQEYGLYRQNYCGCLYSKQEMERRVRKTPATGRDKG